MNDSFKRIKTQVQNGYGVETTPQYVAEFFPTYDRSARAQILNQMDAESDSFDGETSRDTADNMALRIKFEAVHQALIKAGR
ncbi:hypothetical protein [Bradyrhizobium sp. AUGA SZCCT0431]|uniref:hypothetical protein n=1 Tax=Bradyrhizobium sp. AUGA SZCCT0431 TaxID=2807674 RepID=UPI001BAB6C65|nr:hypothetical protein [Bradyrhizobium sp. AUGA SZCCT0431]MBR1145079.1 hypothetical protein [Bradyrhizobium sp. AUGA SZCCT0431]